MNSLNKTLENLSNELKALLEIGHYSEHGNLQRASKSLFQYAFENDMLFMDNSIVDEHYEQTFTIVGSETVYYLNLIGLDYQEK